MDLLPEANTIELQLDDGAVAVYLHLQTGSARVKAGDRVSAGDVLGELPAHLADAREHPLVDEAPLAPRGRAPLAVPAAHALVRG